MDRTTALWTMVLFFFGTLVFAGVRRLTEDESSAVIAAAQIGALVLLVGAIVVVVRRLR